jgi:hypothetical protein
MNAESTIKAVLEADATLLALATGGVWSFDETGSEGINRTLTPAAFDANGILKPCVLVSARDANPGFNIADDSGQYMDVRQVVECYLFQFGGYATIESMAARCYVLLHAKMISGAGRVDWAGDRRLGRDLDLDGNVTRVDYLCVYIRSGS